MVKNWGGLWGPLVLGVGKGLVSLLVYGEPCRGDRGSSAISGSWVRSLEVGPGYQNEPGDPEEATFVSISQHCLQPPLRLDSARP